LQWGARGGSPWAPLFMHINEILTYGYCSLKWRYQYQWGLPHAERDLEQVYYESVREAISHYAYKMTEVGANSKRSPASQAVEIFRKVLSKGFNAAGGMLDQAAKYSLYLQEGSLALQEFARWTSYRGDFEISAGRLPAAVELWGHLIEGELDGIMMARDRTYCRGPIVLHITNEKSSLSSPRFYPIKGAWTQAILRDAEPKAQIHHVSFSPWHRSQSPEIKTIRVRNRGFSATLKNLVRGMQENVVFQTPHMSRCRTCPFQKICNEAHTGRVHKHDIEVLKNRMK